MSEVFSDGVVKGLLMLVFPGPGGIASRLLTHEPINGAGRCNYLDRWWIVRSRHFSIYLHRFAASDWSRDLHDHPRRFLSIGLWGRYFEETPYPASGPGRFLPDGRITGGKLTREFRAPWVRSFPADHIHRIIVNPGETCWTLVIVLRTVRQWGFWPFGRWVHFRDYLASPRADEAKDC